MKGNIFASIFLILFLNCHSSVVIDQNLETELEKSESFKKNTEVANTKT